MSFNPILHQDLGSEAWQIELEVIGPTGDEVILEFPTVSKRQPLQDRLIDFVAAGLGRWPDGGSQSRRFRTSSSNGLDACFDDAGSETAPASVDRSDGAAIDRCEEDGDTVCADDSDEDPSLSAENDIGLWPLGPDLGRPQAIDVNAVNLLGKDS